MTERHRVYCNHAFTQHNGDRCYVDGCLCEGWNFHPTPDPIESVSPTEDAIEQIAREMITPEVLAAHIKPIDGLAGLDWKPIESVSVSSDQASARIEARRDYDVWLDQHIDAQPTTFETWIAGWDARSLTSESVQPLSPEAKGNT